MLKQAISHISRVIIGQVSDPDHDTPIAEDHLKSHASLIGGQKIILAVACAAVLYLGLVANNDAAPEVEDANTLSQSIKMPEVPSN